MIAETGPRPVHRNRPTCAEDGRAERISIMADMVIIAHRRKGRKMWEGYAQIAKANVKTELAWRRERGLVCKMFSDINAYRADVNRRCG